MKIALVNPPINPQRASDPVVQTLFYNSIPLGLGYLAAVLERQDIPVMVVDAPVEGCPIPEIVDKVDSWGADVVGISSTTTAFPQTLAMAKAIKTRMGSSTATIIGGPHVTALPKETLENECFDIGVVGEGEETLLELVRQLECGSTPKELFLEGIVSRMDGEVRLAPRRPLLEDLDQLPFPARHLFPEPGRYTPVPNDEFGVPKLTMISSRGCPYHCIFCDRGVFGQRYRQTSPEYFVSEMDHLIKNSKAKSIAVLDSVFTLDKKRLLKICSLIRERGIRIPWSCPIRADTVSMDLFHEMKEAGCRKVRIGIESGNDDILRFIQKGITTNQVIEAVKWARQTGLEAKGFFMLGHLPDTHDTIRETIQFARSLPLTDITVQLNTPLPGTKQFKIAGRYGGFTKDIGDERWDKYDFWSPVFIPGSMTLDDLRKYLRLFYRSFYLRIPMILKYTRRVRHPKDLFRMIKANNLLRRLFWDCTEK